MPKAMVDGLQTINYHQGLLSFNIPEDWVYGFDPVHNEAVFYKEGGRTGVLRLHYARIVPHDFQNKPLQQVIDELADSGDHSVRDDGAVICTRTEHYIDDEQNDIVFHWHHLFQVDENFLRTAHLSYAVPFEVLQTPNFENHLALLSREMTALTWAPADALFDNLRTVLAPACALNESIVQYRISEQVAMAIACTLNSDELVDFVPYCDLDAWCIATDEAWRRAFDNMDRLLADTAISVEELVDGVQMAFFDTASPLQAALVTAPSLRNYVEPKIGWPVRAIMPCQDFLHMIPDNWSPTTEQDSILAQLVIDEWENSPCALSTELFVIDDNGMHASGRFGPDGLVPVESHHMAGGLDNVDEIVQATFPNPVNAHDFYSRGLMYSTMLQHQRAIESFSRAIELEPGNADYYRSRAVEYELIGDLESAASDASRASHLN